MATLTLKQSKALFEILRNPGITRILFDGGTRSGKTWIIVLWALWKISTHKNAKILFARRYFSDVKLSLWETFEDILEHAPGFEVKHSSPMVVTHAGTKSQIVLAGLDNEQRVKKVRGSEYSDIFINEATQITYEMLTVLLDRLARKNYGPDGKEAGRSLILDCNPESPRHWIYKLCILGVDPETELPVPEGERYTRLPWVPQDNPNLAEDYLLTLKNLPELQRKRMLDGLWVTAKGQIYDEFNEEIHVYKKAPPGINGWDKVAGIDFGYTNPFVFLDCRIDPDSNLWIVEEYYQVGKTIGQHWEDYLKQKLGKNDYRWIVSDHDAEDRAQLEQLGVYTLPAKKAVKAGIDRVKDRLKVKANGKPGIRVHASCVNYISEKYDYRWAPDVDGVNSKEKPLKDRDHTADTERYIVNELDGEGSVLLG